MSFVLLGRDGGEPGQATVRESLNSAVRGQGRPYGALRACLRGHHGTRGSRPVAWLYGPYRPLPNRYRNQATFSALTASYLA